MQNRSSNSEDRRGGEPQRIGEILAELLARYEGCFPPPGPPWSKHPQSRRSTHACLVATELASVS